MWLPILAALLVVFPEDADTTEAPSVRTGSQVELQPRSLFGTLEQSLRGAVRVHYENAVTAIRGGKFRRALPYLREARALCYRQMQDGPQPRPSSLRQMIRIAYVEEEVNELAAVEDLLLRPLDRAEDRQALLQARAILLHNMFLAVRSFGGQSASPLLQRATNAYEAALAEPSRSLTHLQIGYAALLAEQGERRQARALFNRLGESDLQPEGMDLAVAYYFTALGDPARALARLADASRREGWSRGGPARDGVSSRHQAYRMHEFDRLRDHPRFSELVSEPEERALGLSTLPPIVDPPQRTFSVAP